MFRIRPNLHKNVTFFFNFFICLLARPLSRSFFFLSANLVRKVQNQSKHPKPHKAPKNTVHHMAYLLFSLMFRVLQSAHTLCAVCRRRHQHTLRGFIHKPGDINVPIVGAIIDRPHGLPCKGRGTLEEGGCLRMQRS